MAAALHAQIGFRRSDQSQSSTPGQTTNGSPVLRYFLSETIQAQENGSRGTHVAKFLISNFLKGLTYSAMADSLPTIIIADRFPPWLEFVLVGRKLWVIIVKMALMMMVVRMTLKMIVARITKLTRVTLPGLRAHGCLRPLPWSRPSPCAALPRRAQDRD